MALIWQWLENRCGMAFLKKEKNVNTPQPPGFIGHQEFTQNI